MNHLSKSVLYIIISVLFDQLHHKDIYVTLQVIGKREDGIL